MSTFNLARFEEHFRHAESHFDEATQTWTEPQTDPECELCAASILLADIFRVWTADDPHTPAARATIWAMQDGYGAKGYTPPQGQDWSGVRDSDPETIAVIHATLVVDGLL